MAFRIAVVVASLFSSLLHAPASAQSDGRPLAQNLPEASARARGSRVSDVRYTLEFSLDATAPEYSGQVVIDFALADSAAALTIDFHGGTVESLSVNGREEEADYNGFFIALPAAVLGAGQNRITIDFSRPYSADGAGLYRFIDPEDGRAYAYTDFEPFNQNRLFPSFDQPDLKARYVTTVSAPSSWHVIANTRETAIDEDGDRRVWRFPETLPISTYIYALHAGEYHVWESSAGDIPLRLFARESLVPYVYPDHWFVPTRQGFEFFQRYFEMPYPFGKYDQVVVPHFNAGAMENVGAVTFTERLLQRGGVTRQNRRSLASVILHEMAHMWFGDVVTMDWWNGLWLNESFATVMAVLAMAEATEFTDEWESSYRDTVLAYQADERNTTHPIELPVPDTDSAFANFDRITYEKGSATLVQLMHLVGPENFRRGVAEYLAEHAFGNTTIDDFLGAVSAAADVDLDDWSDGWLLEPGTNIAEVDYRCVDGRIESLSVHQSAPERWPQLRTHRTQLGLYEFGAGKATIEVLPVTYEGSVTPVPQAASLPCPDFVYANHGDWDYVRVRLDAATIASLDGRIHTIDDSLARLMLWQSVWDAVLDARMSVTDYVTFALANLDRETNEAAIRQVVGALRSSSGYIAEIVTDADRRAALQATIENYLWDRIDSAELSPDLRLLFYDTHAALALSDSAVDRLAAILTGSAPVPADLTIDPDRRWTAIGVLAAAGHRDAARLRTAQATVDQTDDGYLRGLAVDAARPDQPNKAATIERLLTSDGVGNLAEFRAIAGSVFRHGQHESQRRNAGRAIEGLRVIGEQRDAAFFGAYARGLLGPLCDAGYAEALQETLDAADDLHPILRRALDDNLFESERCLRMAALESPHG